MTILLTSRKQVGGREKAGGQGERDGKGDGKDDAGKCDGTSV